MNVFGYALVINKAWGETWVQCGWKNGRHYDKLPQKVLEEVKRQRPEVSVRSCQRKQKVEA